MADEKEVLNQQLLGIISSMEEQGLVNPRFRMVRSMKATSGPFFFAELIPTFCSDSRTTIREMFQILEKPVVDFHLLEELCMKIKGASSCIGAHQIALASGDLFRAVTDKCKERCIVAVDAIKYEFLRLNDKMDAVLQSCAYMGDFCILTYKRPHDSWSRESSPITEDPY